MSSPSSRSVTVLVPMLNEAEAIGHTITALVPLRDSGTVQRILVADGGSTDDSVAIAQTAGAEIVETPAIRADLGPVLGKGDSVWRAASVLDTDIVVLLDADLSGDLADAVTRLAETVRTNETPALAKGHFVRVDADGNPTEWIGGRVSELLARPVLASLAPTLAALPSPLSGQVALPVDDLQSMPLCTAYGLEIGMLLDWASRYGQDSVVGVDLGEIKNSANDVPKLESMAAEVAAAFFLRCGTLGVQLPLSFPHQGCPVVVRPPHQP